MNPARRKPRELSCVERESAEMEQLWRQMRVWSWSRIVRPFYCPPPGAAEVSSCQHGRRRVLKGRVMWWVGQCSGVPSCGIRPALLNPSAGISRGASGAKVQGGAWERKGIMVGR